MNAVTGFIAIASLLLSLTAVGSTAKPQYGGGCPPFACGAESNHNETLVRDTTSIVRRKVTASRSQ